MEPASENQEIVVFSLIKVAKCAECGLALEKGDFMRLENDKTLCLECADLGDLVFLPSGNVAVTRRSKKYSRLWAVVLKFSKARGRYERQGLLVEPEALDRAEDESASDAGARAAAREKAAVARERQDQAYVVEFAEHIRKRYPGCPSAEADRIARHACAKYSGRVGRAAFAKELDPGAIDAAVRAHVRHEHTNYDELLLKGRDRSDARSRIAGKVDEVLDNWRL